MDNLAAQEQKLLETQILLLEVLISEVFFEDRSRLTSTLFDLAVLFILAERNIKPQNCDLELLLEAASTASTLLCASDSVKLQ